MIEDPYKTGNGGLKNPDIADTIARHKIKDLLGDFALLGLPLKGVFAYVENGGHGFHIEGAKRAISLNYMAWSR